MVSIRCHAKRREMIAAGSEHDRGDKTGCQCADISGRGTIARIEPRKGNGKLATGQLDERPTDLTVGETESRRHRVPSVAKLPKILLQRVKFVEHHAAEVLAAVASSSLLP